ncbi:hypothetical protein NIT7321_01665 [Phaeobacter italicus]|jgi:hypothetical protein|uniref:Uncharacterized protein n=1 Tax=Phaeobacter italicus TaxID=481446 RepID=A0A0H5D0Q2_9RHOB|nr:hypothetical protein [Phaeobacter italicus]CRL10817.1 hypothetical protein NIT7321_01665 [Phaeobacter italicus]
MKFTEADVAKLIHLTYKAAVDGEAGWSGFLSKFGEICDGSKTFFLIQDSSQKSPNGILYDGFDPEWIDAFEAYYASINPTPVNLFGVGEINTSAMMIDPSKMEQSEFYNDWLRPQEDLIGSAALTVSRFAEQIFVIGSSIRRKDIERKEQATARLLKLLRPHIFMALDVQKTVCNQKLILAASAKSEAENVGVFVTHGHSRLVYANDIGLSLLREGHVVHLDELGRFRFSHSEDERLHHAAIPAIVSDTLGEIRSFRARGGAETEFVFRCTLTPLQVCDVLPGPLAAIRAGSAGLNVLTVEKSTGLGFSNPI